MGEKDASGILPANTPKVVLLGDSIRMGYAPFVKEMLRGSAEVFFPEDNCRFAQYILVNLRQWLAGAGDLKEIRVIHWNSGHWDIAHYCGERRSLNSAAQYAQMLGRIHRQMASFCPQAKIVFALTTPMNPVNPATEHPRTHREIETYNRTAVRVMEDLGAEVNDLYSPVAGRAELFADYCHFSAKGYRLLAGLVAGVVRDILRRTESPAAGARMHERRTRNGNV